MTRPVGLYIHIPFCTAKCAYCDFYSLSGDARAMDSYVSALLRAMEAHPFGSLTADTVYFGGGTPSLLGAERLNSLVEAVSRCFSLTSGCEITLEANPGSIGPESLLSLRRGGFNRISFGVQSLRKEELTALGRRHTASQAVQAVLAAHEAGFSHISADLMLGIPYQTRQSLAQTLRELCRLPIDHVSAYLLKVEEGTPFSVSDTLNACPDEDEAAQLYLDCVSLLEQSGFSQYEISNFARDGARSRHNMKYWLCEPYLGLGPAAHSFINEKRFFFPRDLAAFSNAPSPFTLIRDDGPGGGFEEYAMLRLRLRDGLDLREAANRCGIDPKLYLRRAKPLENRDLLRIQGESIFLTPEGFLLSNSVTAALLF